MNRRLIGKLVGTVHNPRVKHYLGLPPNLTEGRDERNEMQPAALLVIEVKQDGIFLYRYASDGSYAGDTWHADIDEAKDQASFEYSSIVVQWDDVPNDVDDVVAFGLAQIQGETP